MKEDKIEDLFNVIDYTGCENIEQLNERQL